MKRLPFFLTILSIALLFLGCEKADVADRKAPESYVYEVAATDTAGEYDFTYDGLTHRIIVCKPDAIDESTNIMIMLHGYGENASKMQTYTMMDKDATKRNYVVVYITGAVEKNDPYSSYGWNASWNSGISESEKDDEGLLVALTEYLRKEYNIQSGKAFLVGFSNGAFMACRMAVSRPDVFTACVSVAGKMPYSVCEAKVNSKTSAFLQINGTCDDVVPMKLNGTDTYNDDPAIEDVIAYLARVNKCKKHEETVLSDVATLNRYYGKGTTEVWSVYIDGQRHGWPNSEVVGFDVNELILDFLESR